MSKLSEKSLKTLEFYTVLHMLEEQCVSDGAKEIARQTRPMLDIEDVRLALQQTEDAKRLMTTNGAPPFAGVRDVSDSLKRADMGGVLSAGELLRIGALLRCARQVQGYTAEQEEPTTLDRLFHRLTGNKFLEDRIARAILSEEEIADAASPELANIRRQMRQQNARVRETLNRIVSSPTQSKYLQETLITQRDGRYVVPVKSEHKGDIPGLVHDVSASGATLFVEPTQVVEANNQIKVLQAKEKAEIERILSELSAQAADCMDGILADYEILGELDYIFAKAKLSFKQNACAPEITEELTVDLKRARHPMLDPKAAVPIDIAIGGDYDTLVITGPNTGGKTVSLKTLGLLCLMAASGLHIPASELSRVCLFEHIYADIGDEQSIEQSLSTFSAHMKNIVAILAKCRQGDLILFDELGAGTDPVEGAALAVSVIQYSREMCALVAATTHYSELKTFALTTEGVENASCEFNVQTLQPTYRLLTGIPGKSNAFAISRRLGLPPVVIERAQEQISAENQRFEDVIEMLEKERRQLEKYKAEADRLRRAAQSEKDKALTLKDKTEDESDIILQKARERAERILRDAQMTADNVFAQLDDLKKKAAADAAEQNLAAARAALKGQLKGAEGELLKREKKTVSESEIRPLKAGDTVHLLNMGVTGTVIKAPDREGNVQVQAGILKVTVPINELKLAEPSKKAQKAQKKTVRSSGVRRDLTSARARTELDVRGMSAAEALMEVDQFISSCLMSHLNTATIIHGKGTGVLRSEIQKHLRSQKHVRSFRSGRYGEGENGVTIVEFK